MHPIKLNRIQHIGIPVTDLDRSKNFYAHLGFLPVMEANFIYQGDQGTCVMVERDGITLELYQLPPAQLEEIRRRRDGHVDHVAFEVTDVEDTFHYLKENGYKVLEAAPVYLPFWQNGCKYFNIEGPDGERLEFNQIL